MLQKWYKVDNEILSWKKYCQMTKFVVEISSRRKSRVSDFPDPYKELNARKKCHEHVAIERRPPSPSTQQRPTVKTNFVNRIQTVFKLDGARFHRVSFRRSDLRGKRPRRSFAGEASDRQYGDDTPRVSDDDPALAAAAAKFPTRRDAN